MDIDIRQQRASQMGKAMAARTEAKINKAITQALGRTDWSLAELAGRLESVQFGHAMKTYYLDGRLICEVFAIKTMFDDRGSVTCTQDVRSLTGVPADRMASGPDSNKTYKTFAWMKP